MSLWDREDPNCAYGEPTIKWFVALYTVRRKGSRNQDKIENTLLQNSK